jgi:uncharacterized membrane protein YfcA
MIHFIQFHTSAMLIAFALLVLVSVTVMNYDMRRRRALNLPLRRATKAWVFIWCAHLIAFAGFVIGVLASHLPA